MLIRLCPLRYAPFGRYSGCSVGKPFFAYILLCADDSFYVGHTDDIDRRVREHEAGGACAYTTPRRPLRLIWSESFASREEAKSREAQIKRWSRAKKQALAGGDIDGLRQASRKDWTAYRARKRSPESPE